MAFASELGGALLREPLLDGSRGAELDKGWLGMRRLEGAEAAGVESGSVTRFPGGEEIGLGGGFGAAPLLGAD